MNGSIEASEYMTRHHGGFAAMHGYFVQRRRDGCVTWDNMSCTWRTEKEAKDHANSLSADLGGEFRICLCIHQPLG